MRYIHLKLVKTDEDKKRVKGYPEMTQKELDKLIKDKIETKVITEATQKASQKQHTTIEKMVFNEVSKALSDKNHHLAEIYEKGFDLKNLTPEFKDGSGIYLLNSIASQARDLFYTKRIRENKINDLKIYNDLYVQVKEAIGTASKIQKDKFLKLASLHTFDSKNFKTDLRSLGSLGFKLLVPRIGIDCDPTNPKPEIGEGYKTDQYTSKECSDSNPVRNPKGFITTLNFPLKPHLTSVKNQGRRGACTAFGTVGAVESKISEKYAKKVNLSEQDLYKKQKLDWNPNIFDDYFGDGYFPPMSMLFQMINGYTFPFESAWGYNPSLKRMADHSLRKYTQSCDDYTGVCSNTNHQAHQTRYTMDISETTKVITEVCEFIEGIPIIGGFIGWACHTVTKWVDEVVGQVEVCVYETDIPGDSGYKMTDFWLIWDPIWNNDINIAKIVLNQCRPIIFCFTVPSSFGNGNHSTTDGKGFVEYSPAETAPANSGGHCVELVGYIDNGMIPANLKIKKGKGGGYFIVKNSWGKCFGDMGYAYLPYSWVNKWGTSMVSINNVQRT